MLQFFRSLRSLRLTLVALAATGAALTTLATPLLAEGATFDELFTGRTLRFDFYHSGTAGEEHVSLDVVRLEGPWPGSRSRLLDDTNLGKYRFEVVDLTTQLTVYSRGFASIYGEWETIGEARSGKWRTFHESQRFPEPRRPVQLVLEKRGPEGAFHEIFSAVIDPESRFTDRSPVSTADEILTLVDHGAPATKVDLLILGDGYAAADREKFAADARRMTDVLLSFPPFSHHRQDFNVRAIAPVAAESGVTDPRAGRWRSSPLGLSYNAFDSERYVLTYANRALREVAAQAPYDALILVANSEKYGGGGILNLWTTIAADSGQADYILVHEFGHSFAGLADEYYTSQVAYEDFVGAGVEPWEPNVTALGDPERLKWGHLVEEGTPLPTPWEQASYDEVSYRFQERRAKLRAAGADESEMDAYFAEVKEVTGAMLSAEEWAGRVGAFEGGAYQAKGLYRPAVDCIMFTRNPDTFCPVCSQALERVIALYTE